MVMTNNKYFPFNLKIELLKTENLLRISFILGIVTGYIGNGIFFKQIVTIISIAFLLLALYANCGSMINLPGVEDEPEKIKLFILDGVFLLFVYMSGYFIAIYGF